MTKEIKTLTGLRGVAAVIVMLYHFIEFDPYFSGLFPTFIRRIGYLGVDVFFVLSGFVMALSYGKYFLNGTTVYNYRTFMIKRIARVYPLYLFIILFATIKYASGFRGEGIGDYRLPDFAACLLMIQAWGFGFVNIAAATWSISTEFLAYIIFPALVLLAVFARPIYALALFVLSAFFLYLVASSHLGISGQLDVVSSSSVMPVLRCLAGFCFGLLCYRISSLDLCRKILSPSPVLLILGAGFLLSAIFSRSDLLLVSFLPWIVLSLYYNSTAARLVFANPPVYHLGVVSYSIYLAHPHFISLLHRLEPLAVRYLGSFGNPFSVVLVLFLTWGGATLLYRLVEMPGRLYLQKILLRSKANPHQNTVSHAG